MVHTSNPRLMNRIIDAVAHLSEAKGSTARDILNFLRQSSKSTPRNLTMQVHRALRHAVNAGLLRHRSGRYKALFTLSPAPVKLPVNENNDEQSGEGTIKFDKQPPPKRITPEDKEENSRGEYQTQRRDKRRKRSRSRQRRRRRRSGSRRSQNRTKHAGESRKLRYKEKGECYRLARDNIPDTRMKADMGNPSGSLSNRTRSKPRRKDLTEYLDSPDSSDYEEPKPRGRRKTPAPRQDSKYEDGGKTSKRSVSRNRSPQRQQLQQLQLKYSNDENDDGNGKMDTADRKNVDCDNAADQDTKKGHEPNNSGSGSTF